MPREFTNKPTKLNLKHWSHEDLVDKIVEMEEDIQALIRQLEVERMHEKRQRKIAGFFNNLCIEYWRTILKLRDRLGGRLTDAEEKLISDVLNY